MGEQGVLAQTATLGEALLIGVTVGIYYDIFRIIRRIIRCGYANIVGQDIFFWVTAAIYVYFAAIKLNAGIVRINFIAMTFVGWGAYFATVGAVLMLVVDWLVKICKGLYKRLHNILITAYGKTSLKRGLKQKKKKEN